MMDSVEAWKRQACLSRTGAVGTALLHALQMLPPVVEHLFGRLRVQVVQRCEE